jgi:ubiquinone/menaquinone biosynthesis C-methylase UbiE
MNGSANSGERKDLATIVRGYDRVARFYAPLEPLFLIFPRGRRRAVAALALKPGATVLELGVGSGRNLPYLVDAVGPSGIVIGIDASAGMLAQAEKLVRRRGWSNVRLIHGDATKVDVDRELDAILFGLSYSAMPEPELVLARAWRKLRPGGRVVVFDLGLTRSKGHRLLAPIARVLDKLGPGNAYSEPWDDLARYGALDTEYFMAGLFYVSTVRKPATS